MKRICSLFLAVVMIFSVSQILSACTKVEAVDLMEEVSANPVEVTVDMEKGTQAASNFGVRLFQESAVPGSNTLISPLSVLYALTMTANGAGGKTLEEMEQALGMSVEEMTAFLHAFLSRLPEKETESLKIANSIWFADRNGFTPNQDFLQTNADYFGADLYKAPFDDSTLKDINHWVKQNTDEMIPEILDKIDCEAVMYLVNAIAFEGQWQEPYKDHQVQDGEFVQENGTVQNATFMYGQEHCYLEDEFATGFVKNYDNGDYAFVALLPNEGVKVEDYIASLTGDSWQKMLEHSQDISVRTSLPKFKTEFSAELPGALKQMEIRTAFDENDADFSDLGTCNSGNLYINRVLHKTYIEVTQDGTKAAASTAVEINRESACIDDMKEVFLNRPFVYMLIDCENHLPLFIGTMMDLSK